MTRPNYAAELQQLTLWSVAAGTVEGSLVSIVASKTFEASALLTTIIWALPILMNLLNVAWAAVLRGRPRKPAFILATACGLLGVGSIGLASSAWKPWGGWVFAGQLALTHLFVSGLINLRTAMWRANYPATHRGRITGRLQTVQLLVTVLTTAALSLVFNGRPGAYRLIYPLVAVIGAVSLWPLGRIRMRGERTELRRFHQYLARAGPGDRPRLGLWAGVREAGLILRRDPLFARYMLAQFLLGSANFFTDPILVNALTKDLSFDYFSSQLLLYLVPTTALLVSIRFWAILFDRVGILRFRVHNSASWTASFAATALAMMLIGIGGPAWLIGALPLLVAARVLNGLGAAGGKLAWNLGHLQFAREHQAELYMGIHVGLTGLRGLLMPIFGLWSREMLGYWALVIAVALSAAAHALFRRLAATSGEPTPDGSAAEIDPS